MVTQGEGQPPVNCKCAQAGWEWSADQGIADRHRVARISPALCNKYSQALQILSWTGMSISWPWQCLGPSLRRCLPAELRVPIGQVKFQLCTGGGSVHPQHGVCISVGEGCPGAPIRTEEAFQCWDEPQRSSGRLSVWHRG